MEDEDDVARRRLHWGLLGAVAVVLIAAIPGVALDRGTNTKHVTSAEDLLPGTTTTTGVGVVAGVPMVPAAATTTTVAGSVSPLQATTTLPPAPTTTAQPAPAPCRNSYDAKCGPFRWDPDPGPNAPLTVTVSPQPQQGTAPLEVNFHIVADDPDAKIDRCIVAVDYGDGQTGGTCPPPPTCQTPYGPWTPPGKVPDHWETDIKHTYAAPSQKPYVASFTLQSHSFCNPDPYGGSAQAPASVTVS